MSVICSKETLFFCTFLHPAAKDEKKRLVDGRHWRPSTKRTGRSERDETKCLVDGRHWCPSTKRTGQTNERTNERTNETCFSTPLFSTPLCRTPSLRPRGSDLRGEGGLRVCLAGSAACVFVSFQFTPKYGNNGAP